MPILRKDAGEVGGVSLGGRPCSQPAGFITTWGRATRSAFPCTLWQDTYAMMRSQQLREYWLSTPRWTCWVCIDVTPGAHGKILDCAPILYKRWRGDFWVGLLTDARRRWGEAVFYTRLTPMKYSACHASSEATP